MLPSVLATIFTSRKCQPLVDKLKLVYPQLEVSVVSDLQRQSAGTLRQITLGQRLKSPGDPLDQVRPIARLRALAEHLRVSVTLTLKSRNRTPVLPAWLRTDSVLEQAGRCRRPPGSRPTISSLSQFEPYRRTDSVFG